MAVSRIGRYEIQRRLGTGGMGSLYLARDPSLDRLVAIKLLRDDFNDDQELRERFIREARSVARLRHPNIIIVHDVGEHEGRPFMAMEYIAGETLTHVLRRRPPMLLVDRVALVEHLCDGLAHAHASGIVHRDIKPANIMIDAGGVLKILDFGIARLTNSGMTQDGMMLGSVNYMSPEQVVGRGVDHRTDIFATGAVLYELITLEQAFPGGIDAGVLHKILNAGPEPLKKLVPDVDPELADIVHRALEREHGQRYQNITLMRRDLTRVRRRLTEEGADSPTAPPADHTAIVRPKTSRSSTGRPADSDRPRRLDPQRFAELRRQQLEEHLRLSEQAFEKGDHDAALHHAERAAAADPDSRAAYDLIDKARFAIDAKAVRQLLSDARQLLFEGHLDEASALTDQAVATVPDLPEAATLRDEAQGVSDEIAALREREQRIASSLERARTSIERGGYETALRAVYEVLALDPDRAEARELEQVAQARLQAKREHEQARRTAYECLKVARTLALENKFDEAAHVIDLVKPPSDTVRLAAAEALKAVRALERQAVHTATIAQARADLAEQRFERALAAIDAIPEADRTDEARAVRDAAANALKKQRELEEKRRLLEEAIAAVGALIQNGDLAKALERLEDGARLGLDDARLGSLRQRIADLAVAAQEKRRQEARDRLAERTVESARRLFSKGEQSAAVALLERDRSGHALVEDTLREMRASIAEQEQRARREAERRRQDEEARRQAEIEAARVREEQRKADEKRQREEAQRLREAEEKQRLVEAQRREAEEKRRREEAQRLHEAEQRRRRDRIAALVTSAEEAIRAQRLADATAILAQIEAVGPAEDAALMQRVAALHVDVEGRERRRRDLDAHIAQAYERLAKGRLDAARSATDAALAIDPAHAVALSIREEIDREVERRAAEAQRQEEARRREEAARQHAEEARRREEQVATLIKSARKAREDEAALDLLNQALTLVPTDPRIEALIGERNAALEQRRADEQRREQIASLVRSVEGALDRHDANEAEERISEGERQFGASPFAPARKKLAAQLAALRRAEAREREAAEEAARRQREREAREARERQEHEDRLARAAKEEATLLAQRTPPTLTPPTQVATDATIVKAQPVREERPGHARYVAAAASIVAAVALGVVLYRGVTAGPEETAAPVTPPNVASNSRLPVPAPTGRTPGADVGPTAVPSPPVAVDANAALEQQVQGHRLKARELLARGQSAQALAAIQSALQLRPNDRESRAMLDSMAREASSAAERAKEDAARSGAPTAAAQSYRAAVTLENDAERERRAGHPDQAVRLLWSARERFSAAAEEALRVTAAAKAGPQTPIETKQPTPPATAPVTAPPVTGTPERPVEPPRVDTRPPTTTAAQPVDERAAIVQTLRAYEAAFASLDVDQIRRVHELSGSELEGVQRSLADARTYTVSVQIREIALGGNGRQARVTAAVHRVYVPKGAARPTDRTVNSLFSLEKRGDTWIIVGLQAQ